MRTLVATAEPDNPGRRWLYWRLARALRQVAEDADPLNERPAGCTCWLREDPDWGEVWTQPPGGCPVHDPGRPL